MKTYKFGWASDGLRGYVFLSEDATQLVVAFKGTSAAFIWPGPSSEKDKFTVKKPPLPYLASAFMSMSIRRKSKWT